MTTKPLNCTHGGDRVPAHEDKPLNYGCTSRGGPGRFPAVSYLHGGVWGKGSLEECKGRDESCASVAAGRGSRLPRGLHGVPTALVDTTYAIRWLKARAQQFKPAPISSVYSPSSGGNLAMLGRYAAERSSLHCYSITCTPPPLTLPFAASRFLAVINPLSRYRNALREREERHGVGRRYPGTAGFFLEER